MTATELPEITPEEQAQLEELYAAFAAAHMTPLWTQIGGLMPTSPRPDSVPMLWRWSTLLPLAEPLATPSGLDAFRFSDDPVFEALGLARISREDATK
ncbi:MAG: hypothetical protein ACJ72W_07945 [Actinoallomurus sp.]